MKIIALGSDFQYLTCEAWSDLGATYLIADDRNSEIWRDFGNSANQIGVVPWNVIIDNKGVVRYNALGVNESEITTLLDELLAAPSDTNPSQQPSSSRLVSNYPNPFNNGTNIHFQLEEAGDVQVSIYDGRGTQIRTFSRSNLAKGDQNLTWYGLDETGQAVPSGVYIIQLKTEQTLDSKKALLLK